MDLKSGSVGPNVVGMPSGGAVSETVKPVMSLSVSSAAAGLRPGTTLAYVAHGAADDD